MPRPTLSIAPPPPLPAQPQPAVRNRAGTVGLVLSIAGLLTGGLLSPVGMIVSLIGMSRTPRHRAGIGVVLGAFGCVLGLGTGLLGLAMYVKYREIAHQAQQFQGGNQQAGGQPQDAGQQLDQLVKQLESLTPEERENLNRPLQEFVRTLDEVQREAQGQPARPPNPQVAPQGLLPGEHPDMTRMRPIEPSEVR